MKKKITFCAFALLVFVSTSTQAQLSETELLQKPLVQTKSEALKNPKEVYRMRINDYNAKQDVNFLKQFENCQALSFTAVSQIEVIPLAMNKMIKLQYLDISETTIKSIILLTKKNKLLKLVYAKAGMLDDYEKKALGKRGITLIESPAELPAVFIGSGGNAVSATTPVSTTTTTNNSTNTSSTKSTSGNPNATGNVNTFSGSTAASKLTQRPSGEWVYNPDNVNVDWNQIAWDVQQNGKKVTYARAEQYAILDQNGNLIALVPFNEISIDINTAFSNGMLPFQDRKTKKYGYLDATGKIAIAAQFDKVYNFINGMAVVEKNGSSHYTDKTGKIIFSGNFTETVPFYHSKYAVVQFKGDNLFSIISNDGKTISKNVWTKREVSFTDLETIEVFNAGLIRSSTGKDNAERYGYKDLAGNWIVKSQYWKASQFTAGMATVTINDALKIPNKPSKNLSGIINTKGDYVFPLEYLLLSDPWYNTPNGEITISGEHKDKGFMILNPKGEILLGPFKRYGEKEGSVFSLTPFKNNYTIIEYHPGRNIKDRHFTIGYSSVCDIIDRKGKVVLKEFEYIINYPVNEFGVFGFTNTKPPNIYMHIFTDEKLDTTNTGKNGLAKLSGEIIQIESDMLVKPENHKFGFCDNSSFGGFAYMFGDPYLISNAAKYININTTISGKKLSTGKAHVYLGNGKEINESFSATGINNLRLKPMSTEENIVSYSKQLKTGSEYGLYDRWQQKPIFTFPEGKHKVSYFSENRFVISQAGFVIEKLDLTKLGDE